jgi:pSer/pThr/pTyr-binding forkhead associated (FHA) protein/thioredoxin reductase
VTVSDAPGEILDLLVIGGGPAGTAAAFRGRELGLLVQVIDFDDLMKRIRDYSKEKLILPGFGGGDKMAFPRGDELVAALRFDSIDKDELCRRWKDLYGRHDVPARTGLELTSLESGPDGVLRAAVWDHGRHERSVIETRHVALCLGRGVPRRFDIPGDTDGIGFRLGDPEEFIGEPACVLGGGTSAAEAVIAISNAKAKAGDESAIYWSYRGDRMPRISRALADVFFEAYVGNGNIRYFPLSEPAGVVTGDDRREYLSVRVDRRSMAGRPRETIHLEFPKQRCLACIGEDLPAALLGCCGIEMVLGGPGNKRRMVVNRLLESCVPNVYLAGDILSQAYLETDDFDADPAGFREVKHRGNIKSALRDGVIVAEVVRQRLDGKTEIELPDLDSSAAVERLSVGGGEPDRDDALPDSRLAEERATGGTEAVLIRLLPTGIEEEEYPIAALSVTTIGRTGCDVNLPDASMVGQRHASISHTEDGCFLRDDGSTAGVFLRLSPALERRLEDGDLLRAGRQFLRLSESGDGVTLVHFDATGREVGRHALTEATSILGRDAPGVTLEPGDRTLSRRHMAARVKDGSVFAKDLKSANGTYLRVRSAVRLEHGDRFRIGNQDFVFSLQSDSVIDAAAGAPPATPAATSQASVRFEPAGRVVEAAPGQTLCEVAEEHAIGLVAECHSGICGSDPIRILAGRANLLDEPGDQERACRLACMVRARGPVEVEIL